MEWRKRERTGDGAVAAVEGVDRVVAAEACRCEAQGGYLRALPSRNHGADRSVATS